MGTPLEAIGDLVRAYQALPNLVTGGQPTAAHLEALEKAGVKIVIDLRDPMEDRHIDEPALLTALQMEYVNAPVGTGTLNDPTMDFVLGVLRRSREQMAFMHCNSGNRVGGVLLPYFMLDLAMCEAAALAEAMRVGLLSVEYLQWALDYVYRHECQQRRRESTTAEEGSRAPH